MNKKKWVKVSSYLYLVDMIFSTSDMYHCEGKLFF